MTQRLCNQSLTAFWEDNMSLQECLLQVNINGKPLTKAKRDEMESYVKKAYYLLSKDEKLSQDQAKLNKAVSEQAAKSFMQDQSKKLFRQLSNINKRTNVKKWLDKTLKDGT